MALQAMSCSSHQRGGMIFVRFLSIVRCQGPSLVCSLLSRVHRQLTWICSKSFIEDNVPRDNVSVIPGNSNLCRYELLWINHGSNTDPSWNNKRQLEWTHISNHVALIITITLIETIGRHFRLKSTHRYAGLCYVRAEDVPSLAPDLDLTSTSLPFVVLVEVYHWFRTRLDCQWSRRGRSLWQPFRRDANLKTIDKVGI